MSYAITEYPDAREIYRKLDALMALPPVTIRRDAMQSYLGQLDTRCAKSKAMIAEAKDFIPGGVQHNLSFNYPFPLVIDRAEGPYLYDLDGNRYIDFLQAGGPTVLGSNPPAVLEPVIELLRKSGPVTGLFHEFELKIAKEIARHMPAVEMFRMLGSGTESVMAAIRLARLATKKKCVIKMGGAYHGWSDQMVYSLKIPRSGRFEAHGIPRACVKYTAEAAPNDLASLERRLFWNRLHGGTAAVIVEPVGPESGTRPVDKDHNAEVRKLCDKYGALLIFDEVVTGFRVGLGGAQGYFGVRPDLTIFGKVVAGGYPAAGGVGGRRDLIMLMAAGLESGKKRAYVGGTLAANPLSAAAGYFAIQEIERTDACRKAGLAGDRLTRGLNEIVQRLRLPFVVYNQGSICHLETAAGMFIALDYLRIFKVLKEIKTRKHAMEEYGAAYTAEGIITLAGSRLYTSMADSDEVIDDALARFDRVLQNVDRSALGDAKGSGEMNELQQARNAVREMGTRLVQSGLVIGTWGNVSVRLGNQVVITPSGANYATLTDEDMPIIDLATGDYEGPKPSSEKGLHLEVYRQRKEIGAVIHVHSPNASTLAAARRELPPILDDVAQLIGPSVRVADYALPSTKKIVKTTMRALSGRMAALMANHGAICLGRDLDEAFLCCQVLEKGCKAFIEAEFLGGAKGINYFEAAIMHQFFLRKYSKQWKDK